ncbi:LOW QUALITY PROTEIN: hypothetical protein M8C21_010052, partial [Ambrosia artemisiifolia]
PPPDDFSLKETKPHLGGGKITGDKLTSTYDLVEQMQYLYVRVREICRLRMSLVLEACSSKARLKSVYLSMRRPNQRKSLPLRGFTNIYEVYEIILYLSSISPSHQRPPLKAKAMHDTPRIEFSKVHEDVETLLSALTTTQAKSHKSEVQPALMNEDLLSRDEQNIFLLLNLLVNSEIPLQSAAKVPIMIAFDVADRDGDPNDIKPQACIFKVGDDCRQDVLALQVISLLKDIFAAVGLGCAKFAQHEAKWAKHLMVEFGPVGSLAFETACENFIISSSGYAVASLLLQPKDRRNGKLLIDNEGRLVHIDFGFIFEISPGGNMRFESVHFKLSHEMTQLLDPFDAMKSDTWHLFESSQQHALSEPNVDYLIIYPKATYWQFGQAGWLMHLTKIMRDSLLETRVGYMFGSISPVIKKTMGYNQRQTATLGVVKDIGAAIGFGSLLREIKSGKEASAAKILDLFAQSIFFVNNQNGLGSAGLGYAGLGRLCICIFVGANGETYFNTGDLVTGVQNFPKNRGPVVGILKGFAGLSGAILTQTKLQSSSWLQWDRQSRENPVEESLLNEGQKRENEVIFNEVDDETGSEVDLLSAQERKRRMNHLQAKLVQAAADGAVGVKRKKGPRRGEDFTLMQALVKADLLLLFFSLVLASGSGLTIIDNLGQMCQSLGYENPHIFVSMISIWNFLGRVAGGYFSEIIVRIYDTCSGH